MEESGIRYISDAGGDNADDTAAVSLYFAGSFFSEPAGHRSGRSDRTCGGCDVPFSVLKEWEFLPEALRSAQMEDSAFSA